MIEINWKPSQKQLRVFGGAALVVFGALGAWVRFSGRLFGFDLGEGAAEVVTWVLWSLAGLGGVLGAVAPRGLRPLYVGLTIITLPIGFVLSYVLLAVVYYGALTPVGVVFRLIGRDSMFRKFDPDATSYWVQREGDTDPKRYFRQF